MKDLLKKLAFDPFRKHIIRADDPTNEDLIHFVLAWGGSVSIYLCTSDYNIAVKIDKKDFVAQFREFSPLDEPTKYRVNIVNYDDGKTLLLREVGAL